MSVILLDPRFPAMIPVGAVDLLRDDVSYTEEVPIRVRWVIADLGGHTVDEADVLVTTDPENELVQRRLDEGVEMITAPSLKVHLEPAKELEGGGGSGGESDSGGGSSSAGSAGSAADGEAVTHSGGGVVDGEILATDEHTVAVAGMRRTARTEVPASVMDEVEDAVALMARALRQGEWERGMTHESLLKYLREETAELEQTVALANSYPPGEAPEWVEQDLCAELSDVLLQVLFHAEIANRRGAFDIGHVAGAFVAKMRSRAPYLFEDIERDVPINEQERLWAEGKERERVVREEKYGDAYVQYVQRKDVAATRAGSGSGSAAGPDNGSENGSGTEGARGSGEAADVTTGSKNESAERPAGSDPRLAAGPLSSPAGSEGSGSALAEAERVIREARDLGLRDADIPTDIRFPMVGLELDKPGESDRRLMDAVSAFRAQLAARDSSGRR